MKNELEKYLQNDTEQLKLFLDLVAAIKTECQFNEGKATGLSYNDFIARGLDEAFLVKLVKLHFVSYHNKTQPMWIGWSNAYYKSRDIPHLQRYYDRLQKLTQNQN